MNDILKVGDRLTVAGLRAPESSWRRLYRRLFAVPDTRPLQEFTVTDDVAAEEPPSVEERVVSFPPYKFQYCPKCRYSTVNPAQRYVLRQIRWLATRILHCTPEHIEWACRRCGYTWRTQTADATQEPAP